MTASRLELRDGTGGAATLSGYASVTGVPYQVGWFTETISPGAFKRTTGNPDLDTVLLVNHNGLPLATTKSGTLSLSEDARGLRVEARLDPLDPDVQSLRRKMDRGIVSEMSMSFRTIADEWSADRSQRLVQSVDLHRGDVSVVTFGASSTTAASMRASWDLSVEQRARRASELSGGREHRVVGGPLEFHSAGKADCSRCGETGSVECSYCSDSGDDGDVESAGAAARRKRANAQVADIRSWLAAQKVITTRLAARPAVDPTMEWLARERAKDRRRAADRARR